jgi:hypothetical protein
MAHDCAGRLGSEAAGYWALAGRAHYGARCDRGCVRAAAGFRTARYQKRAWAALPRGSGPSCSLLATAFWVGIDSGLAPSVECSLHAGFSEQHRPPIFGGVDQHLYSQTPFRHIAFRFGEPPNIVAGISQCSCRRLTGQRYGPAKWTIPRHKTSLHNGIRSGAGAQRNGPSGG